MAAQGVEGSGESETDGGDTVTESELQNAVRLALGRSSDVRLYRNEVGQARHHNHVVRYGLCVGSSDLIGWRRVIVQPHHVGSQIAQFTAIELKSETGKLTKEQKQFIALVQTWGGLAGVARSVEEALSLVAADSDR